MARNSHNEVRELYVATAVVVVLSVAMFLLWIFGTGCVSTKKRIVGDTVGMVPSEVRQADVMAEVPITTTGVAITSYSDIWLNRGVMVGLFVWSYIIAKRHGYEAGRKRRFAKDSVVDHESQSMHHKQS